MSDFIANLFSWLKPKKLRVTTADLKRGGGDDEILEFFKQEEIYAEWIKQLKANQLCEANEREQLKDSFNKIEDGLGDILANENSKLSAFDIKTGDFSDD